MVQNSFKIVFQGEIHVENSPILELKYDHDKLDQIWKKIYVQKNNKLFNGKVLIFIDSFTHNNKLIIKAGFVDYKIVVSSRIEPSLGIKIKQIGVSGITIIHDDDDYILFSTRSSEITEYPNFLELVPSGNIDELALESNGIINFSKKLIDEFVEETGLDGNSIQKINPFCFVLDKKNQVYDICCKIHVISSKSMILKNFKNTFEYGNPELIPLSSLQKFIDKNYEKIIPTSLAILSTFIKNNHS